MKSERKIAVAREQRDRAVVSGLIVSGVAMIVISLIVVNGATDVFGVTRRLAPFGIMLGLAVAVFGIDTLRKSRCSLPVIEEGPIEHFLAGPAGMSFIADDPNMQWVVVTASGKNVIAVGYNVEEVCSLVRKHWPDDEIVSVRKRHKVDGRVVDTGQSYSKLIGELAPKNHV